MSGKSIKRKETEIKNALRRAAKRSERAADALNIRAMAGGGNDDSWAFDEEELLNAETDADMGADSDEVRQYLEGQSSPGLASLKFEQ